MGGKRTKLEARDVAPPANDAELVQRASRALERCLAAAESAVANGQATPAVLRESASVARAIVALEAERRAARKADLQHARSFDTQEWIAWYRHQPAAERGRLLRTLQELDRPRSVLG